MNSKPVVVLSRADATCITFFWPNTPDIYVGYRLFEGIPEIHETPLNGIDDLPSSSVHNGFPNTKKEILSYEQADPWKKNWKSIYLEQNRDSLIQLSFRSYSDSSAYACGLNNNGMQKREFYFEPVENGVLMWMRVTSRVEVQGVYCVQQCLRFSGATNVEWRHRIAFIPQLSEFDIQSKGKPNTSLSYVRQDNKWVNFPVQYARYHTPPGRTFWGETSCGEISHGLVIRESLDAHCSSGMYWERTAYVGNRHPADCLHAYVDFGPLKAGQSRTVHGKFYFVEGTKDDLLEIWRADFS